MANDERRAVGRPKALGSNVDELVVEPAEAVDEVTIVNFSSSSASEHAARKNDLR